MKTDFWPGGNHFIPFRQQSQFSKKELIFRLVEKVFFLVSAILLLVETVIGIRRKRFWEKDLILASGQLIFWLLENIFFLHFLETIASFFPSSEIVFFKKTLTLGKR